MFVVFLLERLEFNIVLNCETVYLFTLLTPLLSLYLARVALVCLNECWEEEAFLIWIPPNDFAHVFSEFSFGAQSSRNRQYGNQSDSRPANFVQGNKS